MSDSYILLSNFVCIMTVAFKSFYVYLLPLTLIVSFHYQFLVHFSTGARQPKSTLPPLQPQPSRLQGDEIPWRARKGVKAVI